MGIIDSKLYFEEINKIASQIKEDNFSVMIVGAGGLIGSCIVDVFAAAIKKYNKNILVIAAGRNVEKLEKRFSYTKDICFVEQNVISPVGYDEEIKYIINVASNADPVMYSRQPVETILTNICGTNNLLSYCMEHKDTRLLLTSSFEAYGRIKDKDVYKEEDSGEIDLNAIRSCYPESKRCSEILARCYKEEYDVDFVIARLGSIYGPTMSEKDSKAHAEFLRNGLIGKEIQMKSTGEQIRSYCYLMDAVSGLLTVLFNGKSGEVYNVASEKTTVSIAELAKKVAEISKVGISYVEPNSVEKKGYSRPQNCILDNNKLRSLGWVSGYTLEEGIKNTLIIMKEFQNNID